MYAAGTQAEAFESTHLVVQPRAQLLALCTRVTRAAHQSRSADATDVLCLDAFDLLKEGLVGGAHDADADRGMAESHDVPTDFAARLTPNARLALLMFAQSYCH